MKRVLIVTTVSGFVPQFEMNNVRILQKMGYEVHYASNYHTPSYGTDNSRLDGTGIIRHQIDFVRSPFAIRDNIKVYKQLKELMTEIPFQLVHCHTPMGGAMARIAARATGTGPVIYTVHGFHFYKGAPWINWMVYYPAEKYLSKFTDVLITINKEDYGRASGFHAKTVQYIPGVGIDLDRISFLDIDKSQKKRELGIQSDTRIILAVGELIKRKNYATAITAFANADIKNSILLICGHGVLEDELKAVTRQLKVQDRVMFLGYRNDIFEIMKISDIFFFPSYQEGLSAALMEAMAAGLPVVCSRIRGNKDLIVEEQGGFLALPNDTDGFSKALKQLIDQSGLGESFGSFNQNEVKKYAKARVEEKMLGIYRAVLDAKNNDEKTDY